MNKVLYKLTPDNYLKDCVMVQNILKIYKFRDLVKGNRNDLPVYKLVLLELPFPF